MKVFYYSVLMVVSMSVLLCLAVYLTPILPDDFIPLEAMVGTYKYIPGAYKVSSSAYLAGVDGKTYAISDDVGFLGEVNSDAQRKFDGKLVYAELAKYPRLYGEGKVPVFLSVGGDIIINSTRDRAIAAWKTGSYAIAVKAALMIGLLFMVYLAGKND